MLSTLSNDPLSLSDGITNPKNTKKNKPITMNDVEIIMTLEFSGPNLKVKGNIMAYVPEPPIPTSIEISVKLIFCVTMKHAPAPIIRPIRISIP